MDKPTTQTPIDELRDIMVRLRDPEGGCPWDIAQSFATIAPYTIEEAYEVADAIQRDDLHGLVEFRGRQALEHVQSLDGLIDAFPVHLGHGLVVSATALHDVTPRPITPRPRCPSNGPFRR